MRYCPICETEIEEDDYDDDYEGCILCSLEDGDYQKHLKQQASKDYHEDLKFDMWSDMDIFVFVIMD